MKYPRLLALLSILVLADPFAWADDAKTPDTATTEATDTSAAEATDTDTAPNDAGHALPDTSKLTDAGSVQAAFGALEPALTAAIDTEEKAEEALKEAKAQIAAHNANLGAFKKDLASHNQVAEAYAAQLKIHNDAVGVHDTRIANHNARATASNNLDASQRNPAEVAAINTEMAQLNAERDQLNAAKADLDRQAAAINAERASLNSRKDALNAESKTLNEGKQAAVAQLADAYQRLAECVKAARDTEKAAEGFKVPTPPQLESSMKDIDERLARSRKLAEITDETTGKDPTPTPSPPADSTSAPHP